MVKQRERGSEEGREAEREKRPNKHRTHTYTHSERMVSENPSAMKPSGNVNGHGQSPHFVMWKTGQPNA